MARVPCSYYVRSVIEMRRVNTRREAFFEMRRYCEANGIHGHKTEVDINSNIYGQTCDVIKMDNVEFLLFLNDDACVEPFRELSEYPIESRSNNGFMSVRNHNCSYYPEIDDSIFWYDEFVAYFSDLEKRKAGGG